MFSLSEGSRAHGCLIRHLILMLHSSVLPQGKVWLQHLEEAFALTQSLVALSVVCILFFPSPQVPAEPLCPHVP